MNMNNACCFCDCQSSSTTLVFPKEPVLLLIGEDSLLNALQTRIQHQNSISRCHVFETNTIAGRRVDSPTTLFFCHLLRSLGFAFCFHFMLFKAFATLYDKRSTCTEISGNVSNPSAD